MKTNNLFITCAFVLFMVAPVLAGNEGMPAPKNGPPSKIPATVRTQELADRLEEIRAMDITTMSRGEKKALHTEMKSLKKKMNHVEEGGVYISVGALIIILLLLILLL